MLCLLLQPALVSDGTATHSHPAAHQIHGTAPPTAWWIFRKSVAGQQILCGHICKAVSIATVRPVADLNVLPPQKRQNVCCGSCRERIVAEKVLHPCSLLLLHIVDLHNVKISCIALDTLPVQGMQQKCNIHCSCLELAGPTADNPAQLEPTKEEHQYCSAVDDVKQQQKVCLGLPPRDMPAGHLGSAQHQNTLCMKE